MLYEHVIQIVGKENAPQEQVPLEELHKTEEIELLKPPFLSRYSTQLHAQSDVAFVGLSKAYVKTQVGLNSCMDRWTGCIPGDAPALIYHHGYKAYSDESIADYLTAVSDAIDLWLKSVHGFLL